MYLRAGEEPRSSPPSSLALGAPAVAEDRNPAAQQMRLMEMAGENKTLRDVASSTDTPRPQLTGTGSTYTAMRGDADQQKLDSRV